MERRLSRRRVANALTVVATAFSLLATAPDRAAARQGQDGEDGEARVHDLEHRVRDLGYRRRSLDNSERVEETGANATVTFAADVLFAFDQDTLTPAAESYLDDVAAALSDLGPRMVTISGHTDSVGEPTYNQDLSMRRAEAVRTALARRLSGDFSFEVSGYGETQPVAPNENGDGSDNAEGRALNRRVEVHYPTT
ncbi:MAG: OmpA family protein [Acidimicrobiales bacterium]